MQDFGYKQLKRLDGSHCAKIRLVLLSVGSSLAEEAKSHVSFFPV